MEVSKLFVVMLVLILGNILDNVNGGGVVVGEQYPASVPQQSAYQDQDGQDVASTVLTSVASLQQPQSRIQNIGTANPFVFNGGLTSSVQSYYQRTPNSLKTIVNNYQQSVSYPTGTLNTLPHNVNVKVTPKGHPLNFPQNNQQQFLYNPTPSSFPFQQNQNQQNPTVTRVTYLSSVATVNPEDAQKVSRPRLNRPTSSPQNNFFHPQQHQNFQQVHGKSFQVPVRPTPTAPTTLQFQPQQVPIQYQPQYHGQQQQPQYQNQNQQQQLQYQNQQQQLQYNQLQQFHRLINQQSPTSPPAHFNQHNNQQSQYISNPNHRLRVTQSTPTSFPNSIQHLIQGNQVYPTPAGTTATPNFKTTKPFHPPKNTQALPSPPPPPPPSPEVCVGRSVSGNLGNNYDYDGQQIFSPPTQTTAQYHVETSQPQYQHPPIKGPVGIAVLDPSIQNVHQYLSPLTSNSLSSEGDVSYQYQYHHQQQQQQPEISFPGNTGGQIIYSNNDQQIQAYNQVQTQPALPQLQAQQPISPQYAPQYTQPTPQQGFQPNNFLPQQPQQPQFPPQGQSQFPPQGQPQFPTQGPNGFLPPFPPGQGPPPPGFEPENGYNPNHLAPFPEEPYESEFANQPPLSPQDEVELEAYRAKRRKSRRRQKQQQQLSQGSEDIAVQTTATLELLKSTEGKPVPKECAYNTITKNYDGEDCVGIRKK
ncbi:transcription factor SPT20 homolog isoform X2 [Folsomia candida]|uniref:transcription factor SPT20 homolog isoform X2 n=1 Tax=Folsomia candida TaxID=158441 RepID=UPI001604D649|nr:transcription factor SPT20 homolog isoform X2 [Folsomia candida]